MPPGLVQGLIHSKRTTRRGTNGRQTPDLIPRDSPTSTPERIQLVEAARAHELLERGGHAGKVVLVASA